jgi:predicted RNase H-like HicB family nuclease
MEVKLMPDYKYRLIVSWSEPDGCWLVEVPELPGAMADGATPAEAVANAQVIIDEWIQVARQDGRPIPQPQQFEVPAAS